MSFRFGAALTAAIIGLASPADAQPALPSVRFTVFSPNPIENVSFVPRVGAAAQKLVFYPTARSPRYEYRGAMPLKFLDSTTGAVVAEATIPAGIRDALLLFSAAAGASEKGIRYQIAVLDDGAVRHGPGGLAIINLSGLALSGTVNQEAVTLIPGLNPTLAVGRSAKIALSTVFKNRTYQSYAATTALKAKERVLLILFPPFYKGSLEVQSRLLVDQPPGSAAAAPKRAEK
ncbi:MAG: hypothetical protein EXS37_01630 [Opitutus sp.]|nr:hypothetical protein [Opitutus sp.]